MSQKAFQKLMNTLSPPEREQLMKTAIEYGLTTDDPAWLILVLNNTGLLAIEKAISTLQSQRKAEIMAFQKIAEQMADAVMQRAANENIKRISNTLAETAQKPYRYKELKVTTGWLVFSAILGISFFIATTGITYIYLKKTVYEEAKHDIYQQISNEETRVHWANTETGKIAYSLSQVSNIKNLADCNKESSGWRIIEKNNQRICFPHALDNQVTGWLIP